MFNTPRKHRWLTIPAAIGAATMVTGLLVGATTWLLMWIGASPHLVLLAAGLLVAGGAVWMIEARREPQLPTDFAAMAIVA